VLSQSFVFDILSTQRVIYLAKFKFYNNQFLIPYLKNDRGLPYYRRIVPADLRHRFPTSVILTRLFEKNGSLATQCYKLGQQHSELFDAFRTNPNAKLPGDKRAVEALLHKYGLRAGVGSAPIPRHQNPYHKYSETPHLDDFLHYYNERVEEGLATNLDADAFKALSDGFPALLSDAKRIYLQDPREGKWRVSSESYWDRLISFKGDMPLVSFTHLLAREYKDTRSAQGAKTQTVMKELNILKSGFSKAFLELGILETNNPFKNLRPDRLGKDATKKPSLTHDQVRAIISAPECENKNFALIQMATGARCSEIAGLRLMDFSSQLKAITIIEYENRTLKTENSRRTTPLLDFGLLAVGKCPSDDAVFFPRYSDGKSVKGDNASANINKWLNKIVGKGITSHCFRHTLTTLLREADVPEDLREEITGHSNQKSSANYGEASSLERKSKALEKAFSFLKE